MFAMDRLGILTVGNSFFASWSYTWPPRCSREERTCCFLSLMTPLLGPFLSFFGAIFYQTLEQWLNVGLLLSLRQLRRELGHFRKILLENIDPLLLLGKMLPSRQVDPQIPRSFPDRIENFVLDLWTVGDELLPNSLVRNLRATNMDENGQRRLTRDDSVAAPVNLVDHLP